MPLIAIRYAIFGGDGKQWSVTVDEDDIVLTLKEEIKKCNPREIACEAHELEIYGAFDYDDMWYTKADDVQQLRSTMCLTRLKNTEVLWGCETFGDFDDVDGSADLVHIVVVVPMPSNPTPDCMLSMAHLTNDHYDLMVKKLGLMVEFVEYEEPNNPSDKWDPPMYIRLDGIQDPAKITSYVTFLRTRMVLDDQHLDWMDPLSRGSLLTIRDERLPFGLRGFVTMLLVDRRSSIHNEPLAGVRMVVQVEELRYYQNRPQALAQLVAASLKAPLGCTPISLLTNLRDCWYFSWFDANKVLMHVSLKHPKNAFEFIKAATASPDSKTPFSVPYIDRVFTKHRLDELLKKEEVASVKKGCHGDNECCECEWMVMS